MAGSLILTFIFQYLALRPRPEMVRLVGKLIEQTLEAGTPASPPAPPG